MAAKDRSDPVAIAIAGEAIAFALAKLALAKMSDADKKAFGADVVASAAAICNEIKAQAPAIGRTKGLSVDAANATAAALTKRAQELAAAHVQDLIGGK